MSIILFQDADGVLWYKNFRIDEISFDEATRIGHLLGTDLTKNSSVLVSISARPQIEPMPSTCRQPTKPFKFREFESERKRVLHCQKTKPF